MPEVELDDTLPYSEGLDDTLPYEDDADIAGNRSLYIWCGAAFSAPFSAPDTVDSVESLFQEAHAELRENWLEHAISEAGDILHAEARELAGDLPWSRSQADFVISGPFQFSRCFYYSFTGDECYSVSSDDNMTEEQIAQFWPLVEIADREEAESFIEHDVFELDFQTICNKRRGRNLGSTLEGRQGSQPLLRKRFSRPSAEGS